MHDVPRFCLSNVANVDVEQTFQGWAGNGPMPMTALYFCFSHSGYILFKFKRAKFNLEHLTAQATALGPTV